MARKRPTNQAEKTAQQTEDPNHQMDLTEYLTDCAENIEAFWSEHDYPEWLIAKGDLLIIGHNAVATAQDLILTAEHTIRRGVGIQLAARNGIVLVPKNERDIIGVILATARKLRGEDAKPQID